MLEHGMYWRNKALRNHVAVVEGKIAPTLVLTNATYLNMFTNRWELANIWVYKERIVYVGDKLPKQNNEIEIIDCTGQYVVPGYIEPHAHPFQLYNPEELAIYAAQTGTTTLINDNIRLFTLLEKKQAFSLIEKLQQLPVSLFWWARYDSQTALLEDEKLFKMKHIFEWLNRHDVVQGGELTAWPQLLAGDDKLLYMLQETKKLGKRIEGHFPGASNDTLTKLKLLGITGDHEAMTGKDAIRRLQLGYQTTLRHSSIRPDLQAMLEEIVQAGITSFDHFMFTTDGSTPSFMEKGLINRCIEIAIECGVPVEDAYRMASYTPAAYYRLDDFVGSIAPGKLANINILYEKDDPTPLSVLAKGKWIVKDGSIKRYKSEIQWEKYGLGPLQLDWELNEDDLQFSIPIGLNMKNDVIIEPYAIKVDLTVEKLPEHTNEAFLVFIDRNGKWRMNTLIKGFTKQLGGLCSSYSATGDIIIIGKYKRDMLAAWQRMKEIGGGIVAVNEGEVIFELPLYLDGLMFVGGMEALMVQENECKQLLMEFGYAFHDPIYSLLFIASTHLPYVRLSQFGIVDVMKREVIVPANMR